MTLTFVEPTYFSMPDRVGSFGYEAVDLCKLGGWEFDPEQIFSLDAIMSHDKHGAWTGSEACVITARQNGKTNRVLIPRAMWQLYLGPVDEVIWTAHRAKTSAKAFKDIKNLIDGCYDLRKKVKRIQESAGKEMIELISGSSLSFLARSDSGGRGLGGPLPVLDEAFALKSGQLGAILPTILARMDAQILYGSSGGLADSDALRELRDRGRVGDAGLIYIEHCAPGDWDNPGCELEKCDHHKSRPGCALDNEKNWEKANYAIDRRIRRATIRTLRRNLPAFQFGVEILTWWAKSPDDDKKVPITVADWELCKDEISQIVGPVAISIEISTNLEYGCIHFAGINTNGIPHVEMVRYELGIDWIIPELLALKHKYRLRRINIAQGKDRDKPANKRLAPAIVIDPSGPASVLLPELSKKRIHPVFMTARDLGIAYSTLESEVKMHGTGFVHIGQAQHELAIEGSVKRNIGDGQWAIGRAKSADMQVDISPLNGFALARWGLLVAEAPSSDEPNIYVL